MKIRSMNSLANSYVTMAAALATLAVPGLAATAHAQTPAPPVTAPATPVQPKINLTLEQRHTIKELIKDLNVPSAPKNVDTALGAAVPVTVKLTPMPVLVAEKVPQIKSHLFFVEDGKVVIVDPKENKVVEAID
jgi:hypothetical protein